MDFYERSLLIVLLGPRRHADERLTDPVVLNLDRHPHDEDDSPVAI